MKNKNLLSLLILFFSASVFAQMTISTWNPEANPSSTGLWSEADNWTDGIPDGDFRALFNVPTAPECILDDARTITQLLMGDGNHGDSLRIADGGTLTTTAGWSGIGFNHNGIMVVDAGGVVNFAEHMWIGYFAGAEGTVVLNGGTINVASMTGLGWDGGTGTIKLQSGVINMANIHPTQSIGDGSLIDITGGKIQLTGDHTGTINDYAATGKITAYGGAGQLFVNYDAGLTIVTAGPDKYINLLKTINGDFENANFDNWRAIEVYSDNGAITVGQMSAPETVGTIAISTNAASGSSAAEVMWAAPYGTIYLDAILDQTVVVSGGTDLIYKASAMNVSGPTMVMQMRASFFKNDWTMLLDTADISWVLDQSDTYQEHTWNVPTVPEGTDFVLIGFRPRNAEGKDSIVANTTTLIDNVQLFGPPPPRQPTTVWNPAANPEGTGLWSEAENWTDSRVPDGNKVVFNVADARECVMDVESSINRLVMGDNGVGETLRITDGGTLTDVADWSGIGFNNTATLVVETGGTFNIGGHMWIGYFAGAEGTVILNGGTINVAQMTGLGWDGGTGTILVNDGVLNMANIDPAQSIGDGSLIDISGGKIQLTGDHTGTINAYAAAGKIIAEGGSGELIVAYDGGTNLTTVSVKVVVPDYTNLLETMNGDFETDNFDDWRNVEVFNDGGNWAVPTIAGDATLESALIFSTNANSGSSAAEFTWAGSYTHTTHGPLVDVIFDQHIDINAGMEFIYEAFAMNVTGPALMLRMHCTFYAADNAILLDVADESWILDQSATYEKHSWVLPTAPENVSYIVIGFRARTPDGAVISSNTTTLIDDVELLWINEPAQKDTLVGRWQFNDATNLTLATVGPDLVLEGSDEAVEGPIAGNGATRIGAGNHYRLTHGIQPKAGEAYVNSYSIMYDFKVANMDNWRTFLQADGANTDDGETFVRPTTGFVGVAATGYSTTAVTPDKWHRLVVVVDNGTEYSYYLDMEKLLDGTVQEIDSRFGLRPEVLLMGDNDGDDGVIDVSQIRLWNYPLSMDDVVSHGVVTVEVVDTEAPTAPANLAAANTTQTSTDLSWDASTDNVGVTGYQVIQDGTVIETVATTGTTVTGLTLGTAYIFTVKAVDEAGNESDASNEVTVNTLVSVNGITASGFSMYPNPAQSTLYVKAEATISHLSIYNMAGVQVMEYRMNTISNATTPIDISDLHSGIYLVKVVDGTGSMTKRFVKE
ncbi:MAG: T9SS type A sorting domain-containing protein [Bacteroidota bacterium]